MTRHIEDGIHKAVAATLDLCLYEDTFHTCFPAGGGGRLRGALLKARGLKPGIPDHVVMHPGTVLWLELKVPKTGRVSAAQKLRHEELRALGHRVAVCRSVTDVLDALRTYGIPHKRMMA